MPRGSEGRRDITKLTIAEDNGQLRRGRYLIPGAGYGAGRGHCHRWRHRHGKARRDVAKKIILVGSPNVGKSMLFNNLTGLYATVSNYPGTTVDVSRGHCLIGQGVYEVVDTPGAYSLLPISDEERVTRDVLASEKPDIVLHVVDAKNLPRMLNMTIQCIEAGLPVILVANMMDEAERAGFTIDLEELERRLGIPVVGTASISGMGIDRLKSVIRAYSTPSGRPNPGARGCAVARDCATARGIQVVTYTREIEEAIASLTSMMELDHPFSRRMMALLALQQDAWALDLLQNSEPRGKEIIRYADELNRRYESKSGHSLAYDLTVRRQADVNWILRGITTQSRTRRSPVGTWLNRITMNPVTGFPILLAVLYFVFYKFVGQFGAGTLVDFIEERVFVHAVNPLVERFVGSFVPFEPLRLLIAGDYGIITLGLRYAIAIVLPIVGTFFLAFSLVEDSGYLPRLAMLSDRLLKVVGLSGRAIVPLTLGLGCDTMATIVTRTLETERERIIATFLMALAIPCSAQLGVIMALLAGHPGALLVWVAFVGGAFATSGWLLSRILPGNPPAFYMELPPLRVPGLGNILKKTFARMKWYFSEVVPVFVLASILIWGGKLTGLFDVATSALEPLVSAIGLPREAATAFLFGFFRRDYGAAGLFDLDRAGALTPNQLLVASISLTLFVPCVAQFSIMVKERGMKVALGIAVAVFALAFGCGFIANTVLNLLGVTFS
ncbi:MAG TPA: ferrous iron transport protein B [Firmicutes bacterium]|nr:ferrous iron transport protein B [Bacillota bacterium]